MTSGTPRLRVFFLPCLVEPDQLADATSIVIDVLRATTTMIHALGHGALGIAPFLEIEETREAANRFRARTNMPVLLGGERGGKPIPGFDLGNSPSEYHRNAVADRPIMMTTTNGTKALLHCRASKRIVLGAFVNFSAVCQAVMRDPDVAIVCAGTNQEITREDVLLAGAIAAEVAGKNRAGRALNDQAHLAIDAWHEMRANLTSSRLVAPLRESFGGRNLIEIGQEHDIEVAASIDRFDLVPGFHPEDGWVRLESGARLPKAVSDR